MPETSSVRPEVSTELRLVTDTDRRVDGQTYDSSKYRASIASRGETVSYTHLTLPTIYSV